MLALFTIFYYNTSLQTYFARSSMEEWRASDGVFNLGHFYHIIVKTLSEKDDAWVTSTMDWWQR